MPGEDTALKDQAAHQCPFLTAWKVAKYSSGSNPSADGEIPGGSSDRNAASEGPSPASPAPCCCWPPAAAARSLCHLLFTLRGQEGL